MCYGSLTFEKTPWQCHMLRIKNWQQMPQGKLLIAQTLPSAQPTFSLSELCPLHSLLSCSTGKLTFVLMPSRSYSWDLNFVLIKEKQWNTGLGGIICHLIIVQCQFGQWETSWWTVKRWHTQKVNQGNHRCIVFYFPINLTFGTVWEKNPKCSSIILYLSSKSRTQCTSFF